VGAPVSLVGYGATTESGTDVNTRLNEGPASIVDPDCSTTQGCQPAVNPGGELVVAGDGVDSCFGDSGGPVYLQTPQGTVLAGVVSRGVSTDQARPCGAGGIYVRPDSVLEWIEQTAAQPVTRATCAPPPPPPVADPPDTTGDPSTGDGTQPDAAAPDSVTGGCAAGDRGASGASAGSAALALLAAALLLVRRRR
jgi:Trypsin